MFPTEAAIIAGTALALILSITVHIVHVRKLKKKNQTILETAIADSYGEGWIAANKQDGTICGLCKNTLKTNRNIRLVG